ncbi:MAG TPA: hypothetical protein VER55_05290, partial [Ardenticatenaceae bacterium]|nr:hypothetical protein [Ardenticatenaceae bacterium]
GGRRVNPLRPRVQDFIDRPFYRRRYDVEHTLAAFSATLREEVDLYRLTAQLLPWSKRPCSRPT